jgi:hypothetical protein
MTSKTRRERYCTDSIMLGDGDDVTTVMCSLPEVNGIRHNLHSTTVTGLRVRHRSPRARFVTATVSWQDADDDI